ncbi:MAG: hypothetical protein NTZ83_05120 [Candidatus Pacearchaeota archaeon]|nr:hypothetical protein [Candidatus Pacearchaeota archaeon]
MAYKKYIQRNGKLYGPYIYESKRVDGKVVSEYHGSEEPKKAKGVKVHNYKKILFLILGAFILVVLVFFILSFNPSKNKITGGVVLGVETSYEEGELLDGVLKFSLNEGELLPQSSQIVFENSGKSYEFPLSEVINEPSSEGKYYLTEKNIQGNGTGYGIEGERVVYPEVEFILQVYNEVSEEEPESNETIPEETNQELAAEETPQEENENNPTPITGNSVRSSGGFFTSFFGLTGMVSLELEKEINGVTSKDKPFVYELEEGQTAELEPKSVSVRGEELGDNTVSLNIENNKVTVTTDYSKVEKGYGEEYIGNKEKTLSLDLSELNLTLEEGDLNIKLVYGNEEILHLTTTLEEGEKTSEELSEEEVVGEETNPIEEIVEIPNELNISDEVPLGENETVEEIVNSSVWDIGDFLTPQERKILADEFGNIPLKNVKSELFNGRIIREYEFGGYYIEYSYDSSLSKDVLEIQMEKDRIKFLKDIANALSKEESSPQTLVKFNESYMP